MQLPLDQFGRFHFVNSIEYPNVPLYLRISEYLVRRGCRLLETRKPRKSNLDEKENLIKDLFFKGIPLKDIAFKMGCNETTLLRWKKKRKLYRHGGYDERS